MGGWAAGIIIDKLRAKNPKVVIIVAQLIEPVRPVAFDLVTQQRCEALYAQGVF